MQLVFGCKDYVVQGIEYIMSFAEPGVTERVIVNLSYGPTTGPHDGTELLENALNALITQFDGTQGKPKLEIVLAAGNAYFSEGHVRFARRTDTDPEHVEWTWRLPPDNSVLCFAEVWMETAFVSSDTEVTLTPPSGSPIYKPTPPPPPPPPPPGTILPQAGVEQPIVRGDSTMWRLQVEPTIVPPNPATDTETAEHGDWKIKITGIGVGAHVHAYVARSDPNMGMRTRAEAGSYFCRPELGTAVFGWRQLQLCRRGIRQGQLTNQSFWHSQRNCHRRSSKDSRRRRLRYRKPAQVALLVRRPARNAAPRRGPDVALPCDESMRLVAYSAEATGAAPYSGSRVPALLLRNWRGTLRLSDPASARRPGPATREVQTGRRQCRPAITGAPGVTCDGHLQFQRSALTAPTGTLPATIC